MGNEDVASRRGTILDVPAGDLSFDDVDTSNAELIRAARELSRGLEEEDQRVKQSAPGSRLDGCDWWLERCFRTAVPETTVAARRERMGTWECQRVLSTHYIPHCD